MLWESAGLPSGSAGSIHGRPEPEEKVRNWKDAPWLAGWLIQRSVGSIPLRTPINYGRSTWSMVGAGQDVESADI